MTFLVPLSPDRPGGPSVEADSGTVEVLARRGRAALVEFATVPEGVEWFEAFEMLYAQEQHDPAVFKVLRTASETDRRALRVPLWIQDEAVPTCCGCPMAFVGQIDDDRLCTEPPPGATVWWHDAASFYVFTCPRCLSVRAVGQQF